MNNPILYITRGALNPSLDRAREKHNEFTIEGPTPGKEIARSLGDLSHAVYVPASGATSKSDVKPGELIFLDFWEDPNRMDAFFSDDNVRDAGARLFSSYEETAWMSAPAAFAYNLPQIDGDAARFVAIARATVHSAENAIAEFGKYASKNVGVARRRGQLSHSLHVKRAKPSEPAEVLALDFWSTRKGLREYYDDQEAWNGFGASFTAPLKVSTWERSSGFAEW